MKKASAAAGDCEMEWKGRELAPKPSRSTRWRRRDCEREATLRPKKADAEPQPWSSTRGGDVCAPKESVLRVYPVGKLIWRFSYGIFVKWESSSLSAWCTLGGTGGQGGGSAPMGGGVAVRCVLSLVRCAPMVAKVKAGRRRAASVAGTPMGMRNVLGGAVGSLEEEVCLSVVV